MFLLKKDENQEENLFNEILKILTKKRHANESYKLKPKTYKAENILEIIFVSAIVTHGEAARR